MKAMWTFGGVCSFKTAFTYMLPRLQSSLLDSTTELYVSRLPHSVTKATQKYTQNISDSDMHERLVQ